MPAWLLPILKFLLDQAVNLALVAGVPVAVEWLEKNILPRVPWFLKWMIPNNLKQVLIDFLNSIREIKLNTSLTPEEKKEMKAEAIVRTQERVRGCFGMSCPAQTKGLD